MRAFQIKIPEQSFKLGQLDTPFMKLRSSLRHVGYGNAVAPFVVRISMESAQADCKIHMSCSKGGKSKKIGLEANDLEMDVKIQRHGIDSLPPIPPVQRMHFSDIALETGGI